MNAEDYHNNSGPQLEWAKESLKRFPFEEKDTILDVGSGDGKITALIGQAIPHGKVIGLDISQETIAYASKKYATDNVSFVCGSAAAIPFKQHFDKLVSFNMMHFILDQEQALRSFKESLKPGGRMLLVLPGRTASNMGVVAEEIASRDKWSSYFPHFTPKRVYYEPHDYRSLLEKVQFQILSFKVSEVLTPFKDKSGLMDQVRPLVDFLDPLPQDLREEFIDAIVTKQISESTPHPDGLFAIKTIKVEVIAVNL